MPRTRATDRGRIARGRDPLPQRPPSRTSRSGRAEQALSAGGARRSPSGAVAEEAPAVRTVRAERALSAEWVPRSPSGEVAEPAPSVVVAAERVSAVPRKARCCASPAARGPSLALRSLQPSGCGPTRDPRWGSRPVSPDPLQSTPTALASRRAALRRPSLPAAPAPVRRRAARPAAAAWWPAARGSRSAGHTALRRLAIRNRALRHVRRPRARGSSEVQPGRPEAACVPIPRAPDRRGRAPG